MNANTCKTINQFSYKWYENNAKWYENNNKWYKHNAKWYKLNERKMTLSSWYHNYIISYHLVLISKIIPDYSVYDVELYLGCYVIGVSIDIKFDVYKSFFKVYSYSCL